MGNLAKETGVASLARGQVGRPLMTSGAAAPVKLTFYLWRLLSGMDLGTISRAAAPVKFMFYLWRLLLGMGPIAICRAAAPVKLMFCL